MQLLKILEKNVKSIQDDTVVSPTNVNTEQISQEPSGFDSSEKVIDFEEKKCSTDMSELSDSTEITSFAEEKNVLINKVALAENTSIEKDEKQTALSDKSSLILTKERPIVNNPSALKDIFKRIAQNITNAINFIIPLFAKFGVLSPKNIFEIGKHLGKYQNEDSLKNITALLDVLFNEGILNIYRIKEDKNVYCIVPNVINSLQDISNVHDSGEYDFITNKYLGSDEEGILILTIANKNWDGLDYKNYNSIDYQFGFIDYYTFDGELINSFAINDTYQDNKNRFHLSTINTDEQFVIEDGQIVVRLSAFPVSAYDPYKVLEMSVDYRNGTHSEWEEVDETVPMEVLKVDNKLTFENRYVWGDYSAEVYVNDFTYDDCSCYIVVNKPDGSSFSVNSRDKLPDSNIYDITNMWKISDRYLMCCYDNWYSFEYFFIDLDTKDMFDPNDRFEFLKNVQIDKITPVEGYGAFLVDSEVGISRIDFDNESIEIYLTYNQCNINRAEIKRMNIVAASDDSVTFAGEVFVPGLTNYDAFKVVKLTRSESNPNVGKNILTLCSLEEIDYATYESIYRFNETSNSSFIFIDNRYTLTYDEMKDSQKVADMCNQICVDIFAGECPDILLNMEMATELDSGDYLIDLSSLVTGEEYFGNIIESCRQNDGGLYQLPLIVEIAGILTEEYNISPDQIGFTYEEYKECIKKSQGILQNEISVFHLPCGVFDVFWVRWKRGKGFGQSSVTAG